MNCTCSRLKIGHMLTDERNLNPDCEEHGTESKWYNSPEQVINRTEISQKLRELYDQRDLEEQLDDN